MIFEFRNNSIHLISAHKNVVISQVSCLALDFLSCSSLILFRIKDLLHR
jgi:hypothetical protein